jgi:Zn-dependent carboxypeptidase
MRKQMDVDECLATGNFKAVADWLKENIHQYGGFYTPEEILVKTTGEPFNPQYYIDYLIDKYSRLYNIEK